MKQIIKKPIIEDEKDFYESINNAIKEGRHVEYLTNAIEDYEEYKKAFDQAFTDKNSPEMVYIFRVIYDLKKAVWREIIILGCQTFEDLAIAIIEAMNWDNDHMHGFSLPGVHKSKNYPIAQPHTFFAEGWEDDPYPTFKSSKVLICNIDYNKYPKLDFEFDYGDSHTFDVNFKGMRKAAKGESVKALPELVDQRGVAPEQYPEWE